MLTVNQACAFILEKVTSSKLDFSIHQTSYNIHFSLKTKFSKNSKNIPLDYSSPVTEPQDDRFRQTDFTTSTCLKVKWSGYDYNRLLESVAKVKNENVKAIKAENKSLKEKSENNCLEFMQVKCDYNNLHKVKCSRLSLYPWKQPRLIVKN